MKYDFLYGVRTIPPKTINSYYFPISKGREKKPKTNKNNTHMNLFKLVLLNRKNRLQNIT